MTERFVIIGAGTMGVGIAYVAAGAGYAVELVEVDPVRSSAAVDELRGLLDKAVARGTLSAAEAGSAARAITTVTSVRALAGGPDVVVEAVPERLDLKREVLAAVEALGPALLASNTSSIPIGSLAAVLHRPERFCGLHFFNPVWAMRLIEVVA